MTLFSDLFFNSRLSYILQVVPAALAAGLIYILLCARRRVRWDRVRVARCLLVSYLAALIGIVLTPANFWSWLWYPLFYGRSSGITLEWFDFSFHLTSAILGVATGTYTMGSWGWFMLGANILLLVPFGFLFPLAFPGKRCLPTGFAAILGIEMLQPLVGRSFDVDDLLTNMLGLLIGCGLQRLIFRNKT